MNTPVAPPATTSIVVEDVCKTFTLQYHRTLKQIAVATAICLSVRWY